MATKENKKETLPQTKDQTTSALAVPDQAWGAENITSEQIIIPKIMLMQPMSDFVTEGLAKMGEFRSSLEKERVLGTDKSPLEIIVFGSFNTWNVFIDGEYATSVPITVENVHAAREEIGPNGEQITRSRVLNFYCLLPQDIAKGESFPFVLSCKGTSEKAGRTLSTHFMKLKMFKKPTAAWVFGVTPVKETNDKGTFFVMDITKLRDSTEAEMVAAYDWYSVLQKANVKVDQSDEKTATTTAPSQASSNQELRV